MRKKSSSSTVMIESLPAELARPSAVVAAQDPDRSVAAPNGNGAVRLLVVTSPPGRLQRTALLLLLPATLAALAATAFLVLRMEERDGAAARSLDRLERQIQRLDAGIPLDSKRQHLLLGMRDEILRSSPELGVQDAYRIAELVRDATAPYPDVPPLLLLALAEVGSEFRPDARGWRDARGLFQVRPTTGRMLARTLGWEFDEEMLDDPEANAKLAALLLDILFAQHRDARMVLADYHGGARSAGLLPVSADEVAPETRAFVDRAMDVYERLESELGAGEDVRGPAS